MVINISVDPGTNATGVCVWVDGKVRGDKPITIRPQKDAKTLRDKVVSIKRQFSDMCGDFRDTISTVAIEDFELFHASDKAAGAVAAKASMIKCATVRGALLAVADDFALNVILISKRQIRKQDTAQLAAAYGLKKCSKDALDSFQIGVCAGFDRVSR